MKEEDLKALEESPDSNVTSIEENKEEVKENTDTSQDNKEENAEGEKSTEGEGSAEEEFSPEEKARRAKVHERQGIIIGGIFAVLLFLCLIGFVYYQLNKNRILGIDLRRIAPKQEEVPQVDEVDPVEKKNLAAPAEDTAQFRVDVEEGVVQTKAYIPNRQDSDRWFYCESCKKLAKAKFIYVDPDGDIIAVLSDGFLYSMEGSGYDAYTLFEVLSTKKFEKILGYNMYYAENHVYYFKDRDEFGNDIYSILRESVLLNTLSRNCNIDNVYSFRSNSNDYSFTLKEDERYYGVYGDKVHLIENDGSKGELLFALGNDEDFVYINGNVIKTTKMFYSIQSTETANGFDYKFYPDSINAYYSQIKFYNRNIIVTNDNKVYYYGTPTDYERYEEIE